jgi:hypothetical protein
MLRKLIAPLYIVAAITVLGSIANASPAYGPNFLWWRSNDYKPGTVVGSTLGNPGNDTMGNPVYGAYEVPFGNDLADPNPWYKQAGTLLPWYNDWASTGSDGWCDGQNTGPVVGSARLYQSLWSNLGTEVPMVTWTNPTGTSFTMNISGTATIDWLNFGGSNPTCNVDFILTKYTPSTSTYFNILATTLTYPNSGEATVNLSGLNVHVDAGDQILMSMRGDQAPSSATQYIRMDDSSIRYRFAASPVPEPTSLVALLAGIASIGSLITRRRK